MNLPPLHAAAREGNLARLTALIAAGAAVNEQDETRNTALHYACESGCRSCIAALLAAKAEVNAQGGGATPMHRLFRHDHPECLPLLIAAGANPNLRNLGSGQTALHLAACQKRPAEVRALLAIHANTEIADYLGYTPLHLAAMNRTSEVVDLLLAAGAKVNVRDKFAVTPLHLAVVHRCQAVAALIAAGADLEARDANGYTPLQYAFLKQEREPGLLLLRAGANPTELRAPAGKKKRKRGPQPLDWLMELGHLDALVAMSDAGVAIHARKPGETAPIHLAVLSGDTARIHAFTAAGADLHATDGSGATPLHLAVEAGQLMSLRSLLAAGANPEVRNRAGDTALHVAAMRGRSQSATLLLDAGADLHAKGKHGATPLYRAVEHAQITLSEELIEVGARDARCAYLYDFTCLPPNNAPLWIWGYVEREAAWWEKLFRRRTLSTEALLAILTNRTLPEAWREALTFGTVA